MVAGNGPSLMGRDWLTKIRLDWGRLYNVQTELTELQKVLDNHKAVFVMNLDWSRMLLPKYRWMGHSNLDFADHDLYPMLFVQK